MTQTTSTFTGRTRQRKTTLRVRLADTVARILISVGGVGTIVAVLTVCLFLAYVVMPLFTAPEIGTPAQAPLPASARPLRLEVDDHRVLGWSLGADFRIRSFRIDTGEVLAEVDLASAARPTAWTAGVDGREILLGFADGKVQLVKVDFDAQPLTAREAPAPCQGLRDGQVLTDGQAAFVRSVDGFRRHRMSVKIEEPLELAPGKSIRLLDRADRPTGPVFCVLTGDNQVLVRSVRKQENMLTGETTYKTTGGKVDIAPSAAWGPPLRMLVSSTGDSIAIAYEDGHLLRIDARDLASPRLVELTDLVEAPSQTLTRLEPLLGRGTLLAGDSGGGLGAWFRVRVANEGDGGDGWALVRGHRFEPGGAAVTSIASSRRTRVAAVGHADGRLRLLQVTTENVLAEVRTPESSQPVDALALAPKEDAIIAQAGGRLWSWRADLKHPESSMAALFLPVQYEGEARPVHVWQSSSGDDAFEPKLGMWPLLFGTIKATFYSLVFGVPLALLAAIYTSEFLHPRARVRIKPAIELMASLPSVVLGFLAALVIAPYVENFVPALIAGIYTVPLAILVGAYVWQMLPGTLTRRLAPYRLWFILPTLPAGAVLAAWAGPLLERALFLGDLKLWLSTSKGSGVGGWLLLMLPLSALLVGIANSLLLAPWMRRVTAGFDRTGTAIAEFGRFLACGLAAVVLALLVSILLAGLLGWDVRGGNSFLGTYVQRNAMIVGFIMGFAIIPIIYTIAEDALSSVPEHLRAASLGAGATPWQTAVRIVIPTAMSGLFSAVMIGLGRAVGETMIVLMAAGGTPILEWNIFNGFRTLSANIATELPEAPKNGTHYRTLFLAALVLLVLTFCVNSLAEAVRLRFRKKAYQL